MNEQLTSLSFSDPVELAKSLNSKAILLVIPAISIGKPGLNDQYRDYLDQSAKLYKFLLSQNYSVSIFALGAIHRGEGFLHQIGKEYLELTHAITSDAFIWEDDNFKDVGLCSVEEVQLLHQYLSSTQQDYQIVTSISQSQLNRYFLHQQGYGIRSFYFVFPDNSDYYHLQHADQEKFLISITVKDPKWESEVGLNLRLFAHQLRDPKEPEITQEEIQEIQKRLTALVAK